MVYSDKKWSTTLLLCIFTGFFGGHRFYTGMHWTGVYGWTDNPRIDPEEKCWDEDGNEWVCADDWYGCGKDSPYSKYIGNHNGQWEGYALE